MAQIFCKGLDREDCERRKDAAKINTAEEPSLLPSSRKDIWGIQNEEAVWTSAGNRTWMGLKTECKQMKTKGVRTYGEMAQPRSHFVKERLILLVRLCYFPIYPFFFCVFSALALGLTLLAFFAVRQGLDHLTCAQPLLDRTQLLLPTAQLDSTLITGLVGHAVLLVMDI
ncbi:hypothetical protein DFH08DRAFT_813029 [Mycena albidolilacea]|uniref:Uncharacterized protein n=1 Tax=Mycena albidolilacea TaxID=1033008 RepID=A0AAD6ZUC5_9AGAR|nr:hypothetical protein DFH08DRAFT_813029 [Mycena albidolilacea]